MKKRKKQSLSKRIAKKFRKFLKNLRKRLGNLIDRMNEKFGFHADDDVDDLLDDVNLKRLNELAGTNQTVRSTDLVAHTKRVGTIVLESDVNGDLKPRPFND